MGRYVLAFFQLIFCYFFINFFNYTHFLMFLLIILLLIILSIILSNKKLLKWFWITISICLVFLFIFWNFELINSMFNNWFFYETKKLFNFFLTSDFYNLKKNPFYKWIE